jgi:hypothetical protein
MYGWNQIRKSRKVLTGATMNMKRRKRFTFTLGFENGCAHAHRPLRGEQ